MENALLYECLNAVVAVKIRVFCPCAGVIYLKNMITQHWSDGDGSGTETPVNNIPTEDRLFIRDNIVEAIIHSPERIR